MTHCKFEQVIDCSRIQSSACSDNLLAALGHGAEFKLRADSVADVVHGSVSIVHNLPPGAHGVTVEMYDADAEPCAEHGTTFRCLGRMPSTAELKQRAADEWA